MFSLIEGARRARKCWLEHPPAYTTRTLVSTTSTIRSGPAKSGRLSMALGDVSLLDRIHVGVEHLLHFMLAHCTNLLLDDAAALEQ